MRTNLLSVSDLSLTFYNGCSSIVQAVCNGLNKLSEKVHYIFLTFSFFTPGAKTQELVGNEVVIHSHTISGPNTQGFYCRNVTTTVYNSLGGESFGRSQNRVSGTIGAEFQINSGPAHGRDTTHLGDCRFVDISHKGRDGVNFEIDAVVGEITDENTRSITPYFTVNRHTQGTQHFPSAIKEDNDLWVAVYGSAGTNSIDGDVFLQEVDLNGNKVGAERLVNTNRNAQQFAPDGDSTSNKVGIAWITQENGNEIAFRSMNKTSKVFGNEKKLGEGVNPYVLGTREGKFFNYWNQDGNLKCQIIDEDDVNVGETFQINENECTSLGRESAIQLENGNIVFAWPTTGNNACIQILSPEGQKLGTPLLIDTSSSDTLYLSLISIEGDQFEIMYDRKVGSGNREIVIQEIRDNTLDTPPTPAPSPLPPISPTPSPTAMAITATMSTITSTLTPFLLPSAPTTTGGNLPSGSPIGTPTLATSPTGSDLPSTNDDGTVVTLAVALAALTCLALTLGYAVWRSRRKVVTAKFMGEDSMKSNSQTPVYGKAPPQQTSSVNGNVVPLGNLTPDEEYSQLPDPFGASLMQQPQNNTQ